MVLMPPGVLICNCQGCRPFVVTGAETWTAMVNRSPGLSALVVDASNVYFATRGTAEKKFRDGAILRKSK